MIQYNNFLMKREQSRAGSRFAECEKSRLKAKILITLALLLTAVTGAWADGKVYTSAVDITALQVGDILTEGASINGSGTIIFDNNRVKVNGTLQTEGFCYLYTDDFDSFGAEGVISLSNNTTMSPVDKDNNDGNAWEVTQVSFAENNNFINIQGITYAPAVIEVNGPTIVEGKPQWTFEMPGSDVVLTPQYAPAAKWATEGDAVLAPTAIEGIIAGTTDAIVKAGTVVEGQGTVMYFATTEQLTAEQAAQADGWLSTLPTAANIADDGATVYVWYYIKGTDTPDGQEATAENTFNDSEICAQPLEVIVLSNKFDITFNAANANTIEAGKATVKVGETAAEVKEGKLTGVKMGSKVTVTAKQGYKFRKVEVKKGAGAEGHTIAESVVGDIVGSDGKAYAVADKDKLPEGVTAVAMMANSSTSTRRYAVAFADESGTMGWNDANSTCSAKTAVPGGTWGLVSGDAWNSIFSKNGGNMDSYTGLNENITAAGGTALQEGNYWTLTEYYADNTQAYTIELSAGSKSLETKAKTEPCRVRAVLVFSQDNN